jgi:hypothetical protein
LSLDSDTPAKPTFNSFGSMSASNSSNPFAGFAGLTKHPAPAPKAEPIIKQTPATFGMGSISKQPLTSVPLTSTPVQLSKPSTTLINQQNQVVSSHSTKSKIERLNESFVSWLEKQSVEHPISIWSGGLQVRIFL